MAARETSAHGITSVGADVAFTPTHLQTSVTSERLGLLCLRSLGGLEPITCSSSPHTRARIRVDSFCNNFLTINLLFT